MPKIRIVQMFDLKAANGFRERGQNLYHGQNYTYQGLSYKFVPFEVSGSTASLGGDNPSLSLLLPNEEYILRLLQGADGNRNSELTLTHLWLAPDETPLPGPLIEFYVGIGAGDSDTTVELRFRSPMSATTRFPRRVITAENCGILPLNAELNLR